jgi:hypothetical protein
VEGGKDNMSKRKAYYANKLKRATHMLFYKKHRKPGVKGWELRKALGSDYPKVLKILGKYLKTLDLQVTTVFEEGKQVEKPTSEQLDKARFLITLRGEITAEEAKMIGWRIDDLAGLAITIAYIIAKKGKAPQEEVERLLYDKLPRWRVDINIDRYIKSGYLTRDDNKQLYLDWRTNAEVDQNTLIDLLLRAEG